MGDSTSKEEAESKITRINIDKPTNAIGQASFAINDPIKAGSQPIANPIRKPHETNAYIQITIKTIGATIIPMLS